MSHKKILMFGIQFLVILNVLAGCATRQPINLQETVLMPVPVAKKIIAKQLGAEWADNPYAAKYLGPVELNRRQISFKEIKMVLIVRSLGHLTIFTDKGEKYQVSNIDVEQAREIGLALRALGSPITVVGEAF